MPGLNRTGPQGSGPMTGRGLGHCGNGIKKGYNFLGRGMRRGWGWINHSSTNEDRKTALEEEEKFLTDELIEGRKEKEALSNQK